LKVGPICFESRSGCWRFDADYLLTFLYKKWNEIIGSLLGLEFASLFLTILYFLLSVAALFGVLMDFRW
jgi:hypothetical protein